MENYEVIAYILKRTNEDAFKGSVRGMDWQCLWDKPALRSELMKLMQICDEKRYSIRMCEAFRLYQLDGARIESLNRAIKLSKSLVKLHKFEGRHERAISETKNYNSLVAEHKKATRNIKAMVKLYSTVNGTKIK